jgi:hypothetical protein
MKKKIAVIVAALFVFASVEAFSFGIGLRGGYGWGGFGGGGLLFSPNSDLHFGLNYYFGSGVNLGLTGDYWFFDKELTDIGRGSLDFYVGAGLFANLAAYEDAFGLGAGIRIPIGLDLDFEVIDVFLEFTPQLGLSLLPGIGLYGSWFGGAIGARFWID